MKNPCRQHGNINRRGRAYTATAVCSPVSGSLSAHVVTGKLDVRAAAEHLPQESRD